MGKGFEFKVYTSSDPDYQESLKNPKREPHRCDDRIEDFCRVLLHSNHFQSLDNLRTAWGNMWACLKSEEGAEPHDRYVLLTASDPVYKDHRPPWAKAAEEKRRQQQQAEQQQQQQQQQQKSWWRR